MTSNQVHPDPKKKSEALLDVVKNPNANIRNHPLILIILARIAYLVPIHHVRDHLRAHDRKRRRNQSERDVNEVVLDPVRIQAMIRALHPSLERRDDVVIEAVIVVNAVDLIRIRRDLVREAEVVPDRIRAV